MSKAAFVGDTASEIGGGKFANGAWGNVFQYLFNDSLMGTVKKYGSRIIGGIGGVLQVASGTLLIDTGAGVPLGTLIVMLGANNIQEAWTGGEGYLRESYSFWFGNNADIAYAAVDVGSSVTGLMRQVGLKSTTCWGKYGNIEYTRLMYEFETINKSALFFETLNNGNTIYSNSGGK